MSLDLLSGGERSLVIVMGFAYLFVSMMVLIVSEDVLESGLDQAYADFNKSAAVFLADNAGLDSQVTTILCPFQCQSITLKVP